MKKILYIFAVLFLSQQAFAADLSGDIKQGAIVFGKTISGTEVLFDGKLLKVAKDGRFVFGFGRDATQKSELIEKLPNGKELKTKLSVAKRNWKIQKINGLPAKHVTPDEKELKRIYAELALIKDVRKINSKNPYFTKGFIQPAEGTITGIFGSQRILNGKPRSPHSGVDIAAPTGTPVKAASDGVISLVHEDMFYTGKTIMIDHGHMLETIYIHMSKINVKKGDIVNQGDIIGYVGSTGRSTGAHLHWGISWGNVKLDPQTTLNFN